MIRKRGDAKASDRDPILGRLGPLAKLRPETLDNLRNLLRNQREDATDALVSDAGASHAERYQRANLRVHIHVTGGFEDFCAVLESSEPDGIDIIESAFAASDTRPFSPDDCGRLGGNYLEQPMLVGVVYLVQPEQRMPPKPAPTYISLDSCLMFRAKALQVSPSVTLELGKAIAVPIPPGGEAPREDRKLRSVVGCACFESGELPRKVVEGGAQVVGDFSDGNAYIHWRQHVHEYAVDILSGTRVELCPDDLIMGLTLEGVLHRPEGLDFSLCTPELEEWAIKGMHDVNSDYGRDAENPEGRGDASPQVQGLSEEPEDCRHAEALSSAQPEEAASRTTAAHLRLLSLASLVHRPTYARRRRLASGGR